MPKYCTDAQSIKVVTAKFDRKCGYCRSGKELYDKSGLSPDGFCIDAYYALYPYLLALLYDAKFKQGAQARSLIINCPNASGPALLRISFKFKRLRLLLNILEHAFRFIGFPKDAIDKIMLVEVLNDPAQCVLRKGSGFTLRIPNIKQLCPASFFSLYPFIHLYKRIAKDEGAAAKVNLGFACPDPKTNITYRVDVPAGQSGLPAPAEALRNSCFYSPDLSRYKLVSENAIACSMNCRSSSDDRLDKIFPPGLCPSLFNVAIPYIITFQNKGYFKWRKDINTVEVQCPSSGGQVSFEIIRSPGKPMGISLAINKIGGSCPRGHKQGERYCLDFTRLICPHLFTRIFPYLLLFDSEPGQKDVAKDIVLGCPVQQEAKYRFSRCVNETA